jgi:hypothetical protein
LKFFILVSPIIVSNSKSSKYEPVIPPNLYTVPDVIVEQQIDILDDLAYETKMNVIAILEFILDIRLDFRISRLISIFKQKFDRIGMCSRERNEPNFSGSSSVRFD